MGSKGISTVIATILVLTITIALAGTAYLYISGVFTSKVVTSFSIIDSFNDSVTIRNSGTEPITKITATLDGNPVNTIFDLNNNLVGYWKMNEGEGTQTKDSSGKENNGVLNGGGLWVGGKYNKAIQFNGVDSYVEVPDSNSLDVTREITIAAWINLKELTGNADQDMILNKEGIPYEIAVHDNTGPDDGIHTCGKSTDQIPPYNFAFYLGGVSGLPNHNCGWKDGGGPVPTNIWTHVAVTYDGSVVRTFINGIMQKEYTGVSGLIDTRDTAVRIGARGSPAPATQANQGALFNGVIDEVMIYNKGLPKGGIEALYLANGEIALEPGQAMIIKPITTDPLSKGTHTLRLCTSSMCNTAILTIT